MPGVNLNSNPHSSLHINEQDGIEAVQAELGLNPRGASATVAVRMTAIERLTFAGGLIYSRLVPAGNVDGGAQTWVDWLVFGNVTVPTWATAAICSVNINGWLTTTITNPLTFLGRVALGAGVPTNPGGIYYHQDASITKRYESWSWTDSVVTTGSTGLQSLKLQVYRNVAGAGTVRADSGTYATITVIFKG